MTIVELRGVSRSFGRRAVLRDVSLLVPRGHLIGVVGENGAGKSTLLKLIAGQLSPDHGDVVVRGTIGHCPQDAAVFDNLTVDENFRYFAAAHRLIGWHGRAEALMDVLRFTAHRERIVAEVSGGTRQKLNLALAVLAAPDLLLLDEPYAGFDWETYLRFWDLARRLRDEGRSLLIISHLLHEREQFDEIHQIVDGRLAQASDEVRADATVKPR